MLEYCPGQRLAISYPEQHLSFAVILDNERKRRITADNGSAGRTQAFTDVSRTLASPVRVPYAAGERPPGRPERITVDNGG